MCDQSGGGAASAERIPSRIGAFPLPFATLTRQEGMAATDVPRARERPGIEAAVVVAVAVILLVDLVRILTISGSPEDVLFTVVATGVDADGTLVEHAWGTELQLVVQGLRDDALYVVRFRDAAGHIVSAGTFTGAAGRPVTPRLTAAVPRAELTVISVIEQGADVVLGTELPSP